MEVALTQDLEELIAEQVESGNYPSPGEVIRDALRFFKEQLELRERSRESLRQDIRVGLEALERGEYDEYDADDIHQLATEIKTRGCERLKDFGKAPLRGWGGVAMTSSRGSVASPSRTI